VPDRPPAASDCRGCFGLGMPSTTIAGAGLKFGNARSVDAAGHRQELSDTLTFERASHRYRLGFVWEHSTTISATLADDPATQTLWSPSSVHDFDSSIPLPSSFNTVADIFRLPLMSFSAGV